jgi:hypothetical protein
MATLTLRKKEFRRDLRNLQDSNQIQLILSKKMKSKESDETKITLNKSIEETRKLAPHLNVIGDRRSVIRENSDQEIELSL